MRVLAYLALASALFVNGAEAGVGANSGGAFSSFGRLSPVQTVQDGGDCWYDNGWNGPGWYQCGNEWNNGFGSVGAVGPFVGPAIRRHHRHGVVVLHPRAPSPVYPGAPSRRLGAGAVPPHSGLGDAPAAPAFGGAPGFRRFGAGGVHTPPGLHAGAQPTSPGAAGGGFRSGFGGGFISSTRPEFPTLGARHGVVVRLSCLWSRGNFIRRRWSSALGAPASLGGGFGDGSPHRSTRLAKFCDRKFPSQRRDRRVPHRRIRRHQEFPAVGFRGFGGGGAFQGSGAAFGQAGIGHR